MAGDEAFRKCAKQFGLKIKSLDKKKATAEGEAVSRELCALRCSLDARERSGVSRELDLGSNGSVQRDDLSLDAVILYKSVLSGRSGALRSVQRALRSALLSGRWQGVVAEFQGLSS